MSISPNTTERGCASNFPQPVSQENELNARNLVYAVHYINCVRPGGPLLPQIVYRSSTGEQDIVRHVFRYDLRDYSDIFRNGFRARAQGNTSDEVYYNLLDHVNSAGAPLDPEVATPRAFISTTLSPSLATRFSNPVGTVVYRYEIYAPGGISVGPTLGDRYGFPGQREIAFVAGIAPQYIRAVQLFTITGYNQGFARLERSDPVNPSIMININFNPQSHPERMLNIENPAYYFMNRDNQREGLRIFIYRGSASHPRVERDTVGDKNPWYADGVTNNESYINAAFRASATNEAYLFMRNEYVLVNYAPGSTNDRIINGPLLICDGYPSLADTAFGEYGIDCAFGSHDKNEAYIFSGNLCALINYAPGTTNDWIIKGPMTIASMFPFFKDTVFEDGIDAAFEATAKYEAYLFRGNRYALINYHGSSARVIAIRLITEGFGGLRGTIFKDGIEAAFASHRRDEAYIFKGKNYALINFAPGSTNDYIIGGVKEILPNWPSLRSILPRKNRGIDVHTHDHGHGHDEP
ncbi:hypothetical protein FNV43_RR04929 [Rhamnella rubrinervis]|uniref:Pierisin-like domain-containing protein n=1 Tax=Rhamnella rubrinervis TaxID=2594499 RepID=A0A8K0HKP9_9ROSA|nr:hypothetical protein FNV43_RR04929 [Rhamnella rubrinervis]